MKRKYLIATVVALILISLRVPIKSEQSEYGGCDIAERTERVSLLLGNTIKKAKDAQAGCYSYVTYRLYIL